MIEPLAGESREPDNKPTNIAGIWASSDSPLYSWFEGFERFLVPVRFKSLGFHPPQTSYAGEPVVLADQSSRSIERECLLIQLSLLMLQVIEGQNDYLKPLLYGFRALQSEIPQP